MIKHYLGSVVLAVFYVLIMVMLWVGMPEGW